MPVLENSIISVLGMRGEGKSFLVKQIIQEYPRVIVIDNMGEYGNCQVVEGFKNSVDAMVAASKTNQFRLSLRTFSLNEDLALLDLCFDLTHGTAAPDALIVIEEASRYVSTSMLPEPIEKLVRYGRHRRLSQIYIARRPTELHRDITAQSDIIVTFRQHEPRDMKYLSQFMGDRAYQANRLPKYHCMAYGMKAKAPFAILARV